MTHTVQLYTTVNAYTALWTNFMKDVQDRYYAGEVQVDQWAYLITIMLDEYDAVMTFADPNNYIRFTSAEQHLAFVMRYS